MADPVKYQPSHFGICVTDLEKSMRFYCDGLGFQESDGYDLDSTMVPGLDAALEVPGPAVLRSQMIVLDGLKIELLHYTSPAVDGSPFKSWRQIAPPARIAGRHQLSPSGRPSARSAASAQASTQGNQAMLQNSV